jgi:hypothetical protein
MALLGFDSGEATRFPTFAYGGTSGWVKIADQPSAWDSFRISRYGDPGVTGSGIQEALSYSGSTALRVYALNGYGCAAMRRSFQGAPFSESYLSLLFQVDTLDKDIVALLTNAIAVSVKVAIDATGQILVYADTTLKQTIPTGWVANEWHQVSIHQKTSTDTLEIKLDSGATIDCSGTTMPPWYYLMIGSPTPWWPTAGNVYVDCIQLNDASGSINNSWPGSPKIATALRPRADTAVQDWTRNTGSNNFDMIKEASPDLDTTYLVSHAFDDVSTFDLDTLTLPDGSAISGICLTAVAKRADAAYLIPVVSRGGSTPDLSALKLPVGLDYMSPLEWFLELDPITSAPWTLANLNATHFGFKHSN